MTTGEGNGEPVTKLPGILSDPESSHSHLDNQDGSSTQTPGVQDEEAAFALVGNKIRSEIIQTLGKHAIQHGSESVLSFSNLRSGADVNIGSSQFNYHLQQLVGHFLEKANSGYRLRPEGKALYRTIRAGTFTNRDSLLQITLDQSCYYCDSCLELSYDDGMFTIQCYNCETLYDLIMAPPSAIRMEDNLQCRVDKYNYHLRQAFAQGVCPTCVNPLDTELVHPSETGFADIAQRKLYVYRSCSYCGNHSYLSIGSIFLHHPAVISFCYNRGLDIMKTPRWELEFAATDRCITIRSTDPWEVSLTISVADEALELIIANDMDILNQTVSSTPTD